MLGVSDGFVAFIIPHTTTSSRRGLNRFARKHSKWPIARLSEEGKEENVTAEHTAYREECAKLWAVSSRRGVTAVFRVE